MNHPVATFLLVLIGLIALYFELTAPGIGVGGLIAGLCAVLFFWSRFFGGNRRWFVLFMFVCGNVFIAIGIIVINGLRDSGQTLK
ncbi:MAG: peptidase, partial [Planctomycetota bacterium]